MASAHGRALGCGAFYFPDGINSDGQERQLPKIGVLQFGWAWPSGVRYDIELSAYQEVRGKQGGSPVRGEGLLIRDGIKTLRTIGNPM